MEFAVKDAKSFKNYVDAINALVDEGVFLVDSEGVRLRTMDPSQIAMVDFFVPKSGLARLDAGESASSLGLNLSDLSKVLNTARAEETLAISLDEKASRVELVFTGGSKRSFKLPLLDLPGTLPKEPKINFDAEVKIRGGAFKSMLKDAGLLSSHVVLSIREGELDVEAHGDAGDVKIETKKDSGTLSEAKATTAARAMYPFEYLENMTKACPDDAVLGIWLKSDAPVKLGYEIGSAKLMYYLAPRVENG